MPILLGAIGDDMTGSTDLALMLGKNGMSVVQYIGQPQPGAAIEDAQAAVVGLKSRTIPVDRAIYDSLAACDWLIEQGARQIFFKYCSTFDSTAKGNIGPVAEALLKRLQGEITIFCPAFPENGRTVYNGHLFVGQDLLSESSMRHHPLTPMTDSNLVRFLGRQVHNPQDVGLISYSQVASGPETIKEALRDLINDGCRYAVVDALSDDHLRQIGAACADLKLITGGSGVAMGLAENFRRAGLLDNAGGLAELPDVEGNAVVLAGSCSEATRRQVGRMADRHPALAIDPLALAEGDTKIADILNWARSTMQQGPLLIYSTAEPRQVEAVQAKLGRDEAGHLVEKAFAELAAGLYEAGARKWIVAGGETSGAVLSALDVSAIRIGPEIAPGVPWTVSVGDEPVCLALKSGNFGDDDFFETALKVLP
jgi:uncharacterized protein YgbK (DUF1537 family)